MSPPPPSPGRRLKRDAEEPLKRKKRWRDVDNDA